MGASWDDEYLTVREIAERLKLNQQTVRNWIDQGLLPAVRISRRVRVRRVDVDRILAEGVTVAVEPRLPNPVPADARAELAPALERARQLLGRRSAARRPELAEALQDLADAVAAALRLLTDQSSPEGSAEIPGSATSPGLAEPDLLALEEGGRDNGDQRAGEPDDEGESA